MSSTVAACAALLLVAPATAANAAAGSRLKIATKTSAFYLYDGSVLGTGPELDAVRVNVQVQNCPLGYYMYMLHMEFIQDGVSYPIASTALGVGEFYCSATDTAPHLSMGFYGNALHPGAAQVITSIVGYTENTSVLLAESSRTVRIPAGANNQP
ncbi:MAG: hypothetical protein ABIQ09_03295 [Jatrophihabitantaceae bacterium]